MQAKTFVKQIKKAAKHPKRPLLLTHERNIPPKHVSTDDIKYFLYFKWLFYGHIFSHDQKQLLEFFLRPCYRCSVKGYGNSTMDLISYSHLRI